MKIIGNILSVAVVIAVGYFFIDLEPKKTCRAKRSKIFTIYDLYYG